MAPMTAQNRFTTPFQNYAAEPVNKAFFAFPKVENGNSNNDGGGVPAARPESDFPRGLLKYENDE